MLETFVVIMKLAPNDLHPASVFVFHPAISLHFVFSHLYRASLKCNNLNFWLPVPLRLSLKRKSEKSA